MTYEEYQKLDHSALLAKGQAIYREKIRPLVHPQHKGKMVIIDVETGDYEMDDSPSHPELTARLILSLSKDAADRLLKRRPGCYTHGVRVGYKVPYSFGGRSLPEDEC